MSEKILAVEEDQGGDRLDVFLAQHLSASFSRSAIKRLIDKGAVTVDEKQVRAHHKIHTGEHIRIVFEEDQNQDKELKPEDIVLDIVYEDEYLLVLNKPVGMLVHPVHGKNSGTLVNALLHHCERLSTVNDADRPGIVHRLDRGTSGIMIAVKDNAVHENLAKQFERHKVRKKYVAIVKGKIELDEGVIDAPIARHAVHFDKKSIAREDQEGRQAKTLYRVVRRLGSSATVVALFPKTGRTHQLRVHMKHLGHPILGDDKYGSAQAFPRLALHAQGVRFYHPGLSGFLEFSIPLPEEFLHPEQFLH